MFKNNKKTMKTLAFSIGLAFLTLMANNLNAQDRGLFGMGKSSADYDYSSGESLMRQGEPNVNGGITNDSFGAPLGSGIGILLVAGAGYAIVRRKRSRKNTMLLLACVALLGFTQCKKEQPLEPTNDGNSTRITLNVNNGSNNGSRVNVSGADVAFTNGDKILVVSNGHYVGTLTHNGTYFNGTITDPVEGQPLYFYFLGNKDTGTLTPGTSGSTSCTVNISDQSNYPHLPVISMAPSDQTYPSDGNQYTASLHNKCSLMKFKVTTSSNQPICITGMNNKVIINFSEAANDGANNGFTYDKDGDGIIKLKGNSGAPAQKWAIVLPQPALSAGADGTAYTNEENQRYKGNRPALDAISSNQFLDSGVSLDVNTEDNSSTVDLSKLVYHYRANDGEILTGTLAGNYKISIADGAEVTLSDATINGENYSSCSWAGLSCLGGATIDLADGTINTVRGFYENFPGIHIPEGNTLTIQGTGTLDVSNNGDGAGIGGGWVDNCGNILIKNGIIIATGSRKAAGIGSGFHNSCGFIEIQGGTITATGGDYAAGIGTGENGNCGNITITDGVTRVTATKGSSATYSIGTGVGGTCGTVTIGGVVGAISISPYTYEPTPEGALSGKFTINPSGDQVYFSQGNLKYSAGTWSFHTNQYDMCFTAAGDVSTSYNAFGTFDLFGYGTSGYNDKYPYMTGRYDDYYEDHIAGTEYDWGVHNTISNGGTGWRTLTRDEWDYLLEERTTSSNVLYAKATVNGVAGLIILPDDWSTGYYDLSIVANSANSSFNETDITLSEWSSALEAHGAVFLPVFGFRDEATINNAGGFLSYYWSSTYQGYDSGPNAYCAYYLTLGEYYDDYYQSGVNYVATNTYGPVFAGAFVRLVKDAN